MFPSPEELIPDEEMIQAFANADFGSTSKRDILAGSLLKTACGYHTGSTARAILVDLRLVSSGRVDPMKVPTLRKRGREYLWACFHNVVVDT